MLVYTGDERAKVGDLGIQVDVRLQFVDLQGDSLHRKVRYL